jgi:hypothetical protein
MKRGDSVIAAVLAAPADKQAAMLTRLAYAAAERSRGPSARRLRRLLADHFDNIADSALTVARQSGAPMTGLLAAAVAKRRDVAAARWIAQALGEGHGDLAVVEIACRRLTVADALARGVADDPVAIMDDAARLVEQLHATGRSGAGVALLRRVLSAFRRAGLATPLGLMCQLGGLAAALGDYRRAETIIRKALASAEQAGLAPVQMADDWINLAAVRSNLLDRQGALAASRKAVALLEDDDNPGPYSLEDRWSLLAVALSNYALYLQEADDPAAARDAASRAVSLNEKLTARNPAAHAVRLAESLINASFIFALSGDMTAARGYSGRAVAETKNLPPATMAAHGGSLVSAMINHAIDLERQGETEHAMEMATGAADWAEKLLKKFGAEFLEPSVDALLAVCNIGLQGEYFRDARAAGERALRLSADLPDEAMGFKALAILPNLSDVYAKSGAQAAALEAADQAYRLLREGEQGEGAFLIDLETRIGIRDTYAKRLAEAGRITDAVAMARDAVALAAAPTSGGVSAAPAHALVHLANMLADLGDQDGARAAADEAVRVLERLAAVDADWANEELPTALYTQAKTGWEAGDADAARVVLDRAVALNRMRVDRDPQGSLADLAAALELSAIVANRMGDVARASAEIDEANGYYQQLLDECGEGFAFDLANGLHNRAMIAMTSDDVAGAIALQQRAADLLDGIAEKDANGQKLAADALVNLGLYHAMAGRVEDGLAAVDRVPQLMAPLVADWPPARQTVIGAKTARARLLIIAERYEEAFACAKTALAEMGREGDDFWRGAALVNRAMAAAALGRDDAEVAARDALAYHLNGLNDGDADDLHGYCDAAAVVIDIAATAGPADAAMVHDLLAPLPPWFARLGPDRGGVAAAELVRALEEHCGGVAAWPQFHRPA